VVPLYKERYIVLASKDELIPEGNAMSWTEAARLPLALLTPDMRIRKVIDNAFEQNGDNQP
jgi:hypothetical protein